MLWLQKKLTLNFCLGLISCQPMRQEFATRQAPCPCWRIWFRDPCTGHRVWRVPESHGCQALVTFTHTNERVMSRDVEHLRGGHTYVKKSNASLGLVTHQLRTNIRLQLYSRGRTVQDEMPDESIEWLSTTTTTLRITWQHREYGTAWRRYRGRVPMPLSAGVARRHSHGRGTLSRDMGWWNDTVTMFASNGTVTEHHRDPVWQVKCHRDGAVWNGHRSEMAIINSQGALKSPWTVLNWRH